MISLYTTRTGRDGTARREGKGPRTHYTAHTVVHLRTLRSRQTFISFDKLLYINNTRAYGYASAQREFPRRPAAAIALPRHGAATRDTCIRVVVVVVDVVVVVVVSLHVVDGAVQSRAYCFYSIEIIE